MNPKQAKWESLFAGGYEYIPQNEIILDHVLSYVSPAPRTVLDVGCGSGDSVVKLAKRGLTVVGIDWSKNALSKACTRAEAIEVLERVSFEQVDLECLDSSPVIDKQFDVVFCKLVIAFIEDKERFCTAMKSLLSPDGVCVIVTPVLHDRYVYAPEDKPDIAVPYLAMSKMLTLVFDEVIELNHTYYAHKGDLVTFVCRSRKT